MKSKSGTSTTKTVMKEMCEENIKNRKESIIIIPYWLKIYMETWCDQKSRVFGTERDRTVESVREYSQGGFCKNVGEIEILFFQQG